MPRRSLVDPASLSSSFERAKYIRYRKENTFLVRKFKKPPRKETVSDFIATPYIGTRIKKGHETRIGLIPDESITRSGLYHWLMFTIDAHSSDKKFKFEVFFNDHSVLVCSFKNTGLALTLDTGIKPWLVSAGGGTNWVTFKGESGPGGFDLISLCFHYHKTIEVS